MTTNNIPNAGSDEAIKQGCKCPVMDNHYGEGIPNPTGGTNLFWINAQCPLHGVQEKKDDPR